MQYQQASKSALKEQPKLPPSSLPHQASLSSDTAHPLLKLQRTIGNQAVQTLLRSNELLQAKLQVNQPGDVFEQEADHVAELVMRTPELTTQPACACGGGCPKTRTEQLSLDHELLQTRHVQAQIAGETTAPPIVEEVLHSPGQPIDAPIRGLFERRFGYDFSRVRIHTDAKAAESTTATNSLAYTVGSHIAFAANRYAPETSEGRKLLAHELAHVLQQHSGSLARQPAPQTTPSSPKSVIADANTRRIGTLLFVLSELSDVITSVQLGLEPNPYTFTVPAIQSWLFVSPGDLTFLTTVQNAMQLYLRNLALTPRLFYQSNTVQVDPFGNACPPNFAYSRGGVDPIFFCDNFINAGIGCQRDVMIHEHFHLLGLALSGREPAASTTTQALASPDSLSQMAAEIADGPHAPCCLGTC